MAKQATANKPKKADDRPALGFFVGKDGKIHPRCGPKGSSEPRKR